MPEQRREAENADPVIARQVADIVLTKPTEPQFELIRSFMDDRATIEPKDLFAFRVVGSSNGLDSYFTRQAGSSLINFAAQYADGQSLMGSHATREFSYGNSFAGEIIDADPLKRNYEPAFFKRYAGIEKLKATQWAVGDYYMLRGITLNGQPVDDLIKAMEAGVVRKASVSFYVGQYRCGIDGEVMHEDFFGPLGDGEKCKHFPGVVDKDAGVAWADMEDNDLLETSMVFKNASPGAMLLRRAETMAVRGILPAADIARIEQTFEHRLPRFERRQFAGARANEEDPVTDDPTKNPPADDPPADPPADPPPADDPPADPPTPTVEELQTELTASNERLAAFEARETALTEALGEAPTVELIRSMKRSSQLGDELYRELVEEAVKARIGVQGDKFSADRYRTMLMRERDVVMVKEERDSYLQLKAETFKAGRQVPPSDVQPDKGRKPAPVSDGPNLLAPRTPATK